MKNYLKGFAVAILISLATYAVISCVRLAERYVQAIELREMYFVDSHVGRPFFIIDKKEKVIYRWSPEDSKFIKYQTK